MAGVPGGGLVGRLWGISRLAQTGVGTPIEAAEAPVGTVEVRNPDRPTGGELSPALVGCQGTGRGTGGGGGLSVVKLSTHTKMY